MNKALEKEVQNSILEYLELVSRQYKLEFWRSNNLASPKVVNGKMVGFRSFNKHAPKGLSDIVVIFAQKRGLPAVCFLEVKREGVRTISDSQKEFKARIEKVGGIYEVANCIEDVEKIVKRYGVCYNNDNA